MDHIRGHLWHRYSVTIKQVMMAIVISALSKWWKIVFIIYLYLIKSTIHWFFISLKVPFIGSLFQWKCHLLVLYLIKSIIHWFFISLKVPFICSLFQWKYHSLVLYFIKSSIHWFFISLKVAFIDSLFH